MYGIILILLLLHLQYLVIRDDFICMNFQEKWSPEQNSPGCTIASKINGTSKGVYLPISKLHSILAAANLLAHNNKSQICYCAQILLQSAAVNCSFSDTFGGNIYFAGDGTYQACTLHKHPNWLLID